MTKEQIFDAVKSLPATDRLELARWIVDEDLNDSSDVVAEEETLKELDRRWQNYLNDPTSSIDADTVIEEALELIRKHE